MPGPHGSTCKQVGNPIKLSETHEDTFTAPPTVGQHNQEVLGGLLGISDAELADLRDAGVIS